MAKNYQLPDHVLGEKKLSGNEKVLYALIYTYAEKKKYFMGSNRLLGNILHFHRKTIQRQLGRLRDKGYIEIKIIRDIDSDEVLERRIYIKK